MALSSGLDSLDPDRPAPLPPRWAPLGRFGRGGARGDGYAGRNRQIRLGGVDGSRDTSESEALRAPSPIVAAVRRITKAVLNKARVSRNR